MRVAVVFLLFASLQVVWGAKPNYSYHVKIDDPQEANFQEKAETRLLENAKGFYSVLEPNGALRTVTYTADERGFIPVVSYSYGHPVKPEFQKIAHVNARPTIPLKVVSQPVRQLLQPAPIVHHEPALTTQYIQSTPVALPQRLVSTPTLAAGPGTTFISGAAPLRKTLVATNGGPVGIGGYSYGIASADNYALSYGTPGFSYSATRKFSHPAPVYASPVPVVARPVIQKQILQPAPVVVQKQIVQTAPLVVPSPVIQKEIVQPVQEYGPPGHVPPPPVSAPVQEYGPPSHVPPPVIQHYTPQYAPQYVPPPPQYIQEHRVLATPVVHRQIHTVQPAQVALPQPQQIRFQATSAILPASPHPVPQIAYGAPAFNYRAPEIRAPIAYAPQHVQYAPAPYVKPVQLAQPQIQLSQLSQAQINYVPPQLPAPVVQSVPLTTEVRIPAPAPVVATPVVQKQILSPGNGLRITGNALAVPAANGLKNPLTFAYSYGSGASQVSHSYSGSGW